jgi:hypothetical protein
MSISKLVKQLAKISIARTEGPLKNSFMTSLRPQRSERRKNKMRTLPELMGISNPRSLKGIVNQSIGDIANQNSAFCTPN